MDKTSCAPRHAAPDYGLRKNGKVFAMTCLNLPESRKMAEALRKDGAIVGVFETSQRHSSVPQEGPSSP